MKNLFKKPLIAYVIGLFILIISAGGILSLIVTDYIILFAVLLFIYFVLIFLLLQISDQYIKPLEQTTKVVTKLTDGNYRARIHHQSTGIISQLNNNINRLARSLNKLSIHEKMQADQLTTVIDNMESGIVLIDEKGYIHLVNRKFIQTFGKDHKHYLGHLYYNSIENTKVHKTVQDTFLYEQKVKHSFIHMKDKEKFFLQIVGAPIFNEEKKLKGTVLVIHDITEIKKLEVMRKDFVANVSHELRTPITSIMGFAETLVDGAKEEQESLNHFLEIIYEESKRMQVLIDDLLVLSNLEHDEHKIHCSKVSMDEILADVKPIINQLATKREVHFTIQMDEQPTLMADKEKVKQLLINLLANAVNYTPNNGKVSLMIDDQGEYVRIRVSDTGIGIEQEQIKRLFERFYRVDKARSRNTGGTGLGLAIVKHIVEAHRGSITVDSELNQGTTFTIYLPKKH